MALIDCRECGRMASDQAAACPHCGAPVAPSPVGPQLDFADLAAAQRSVGFWLGLGVVLLPVVFTWFLLRQGHSTRSRCMGVAWLVIMLVVVLGHAGKGVASSAAAPSQPAKVVQQVEPLPEYSAQQMVADYERNTVAADQRYKGKRFKVTGMVASINTDLFGNPYVTLRGGVNPFMQPQFKLDSAHRNYAAGLQKGLPITLVCRGRGDVAKTPMSDECVPVN